MRYFSLFSGIGGFELGIEKAYKSLQDNVAEQGRQHKEENAACLGSSRMVPKYMGQQRMGYPICVGFSEIDKWATRVYRRHFNGHKNYGDATKIKTGELPDFDLLVAGFPCQAFSVAGRRKGFQDTRGTLFFEIARICRDKRPRHILLENVKGLLSNKSGETFQVILKVLSDIGYILQWEVLNSKNFGVPQNRERVFIVGHLGGEPRPEVFPIRGSSKEIQRKMDETLSINFEVIRKGYFGNGIKKGISYTLNTSCGSNHIINWERRITPLECERLQGFPDNWTKWYKNNKVVSDTQRYKVLGNAVTVDVAEEVIRRIFK